MTKKQTTAKAKTSAVKKEEVKTPKTTTPEVKPTEEVKAEKKSDVIGSLKGGKEVHQKISAVRIKPLSAPISKRDLPKDIARWLTNKGYGTNVYMQPKEWLEKHNVDPVMLEKLKKFINDKYL